VQPQVRDGNQVEPEVGRPGTRGRLLRGAGQRRPDAVLDGVDDRVVPSCILVADGRAPSRAAVVSQALQRERRRELAARDAAILASLERDEDVEALADHVARTPLDDLD
jgi:hypothetical protein